MMAYLGNISPIDTSLSIDRATLVGGQTSLGFFPHAPNLFVWLKEATKQILSGAGRLGQVWHESSGAGRFGSVLLPAPLGPNDDRSIDSDISIGDILPKYAIGDICIS